MKVDEILAIIDDGLLEHPTQHPRIPPLPGSPTRLAGPYRYREYVDRHGWVHLEGTATTFTYNSALDGRHR